MKNESKEFITWEELRECYDFVKSELFDDVAFRIIKGKYKGCVFLFGEDIKLNEEGIESFTIEMIDSPIDVYDDTVFKNLCENILIQTLMDSDVENYDPETRMLQIKNNDKHRTNSDQQFDN